MTPSYCEEKCYKKKKPAIAKAMAGFCREDRIRTCDPVVPNHVFYRAELPPELIHYCCLVSQPQDTLKMQMRVAVDLSGLRPPKHAKMQELYIQ